MQFQRVVRLCAVDKPSAIGSGYLIGQDLILTARHVVGSPGTEKYRTEVKAYVGHSSSGPIHLLHATPAWPLGSGSTDIAVLRTTEPVPFVVSPPQWGRVTGSDQLAVTGVGFPAFTEYVRGEDRPEQLVGLLAPGSEGLGGAYVIDHLAAPDIWTGAKRGWGGASGTAVFVGEVLIGVAILADAGVPGRLHVEPIHRLFSDRTFCETVGLAEGFERHLVKVRGGEGDAPIPHMLPSIEANLVGRANELRALTEHLTHIDRPGQVSVSVVTGQAGVGKTALVRTWGHQFRPFFPAGNLYYDLNGFSPEPPATAEQVLNTFLAQLGMPNGEIPVDRQALEGAFRTRTCGRKLLIVLDNARNSRQVRPLIPGDSACHLMVTSRNRLAGLGNRGHVHAIALEVLSPADAEALVCDIIGAERAAAAGPETLSRLVKFCGYLPLALSIVAAGICAKPMESTHVILRRLLGEPGKDESETGESGRLAQVVISGPDADDSTNLTAVLSWSLAALSRRSQTAFLLLGLHPPTIIGPEAVAALTGTSEHEAEDLIDELVGLCLLDQVNTRTFRLHDLTRLFAAEQGRADPTVDRRSAVRRELSWYLHTVDAADRMLMPYRRRDPLPPLIGVVPVRTFPDREAALDWFEDELDTIVGLGRIAKAFQEYESAWQLPRAMSAFLSLRKPWTQWEASHETALEAAREGAERFGEAWVLRSIGLLRFDRKRWNEALHCFEESLVIRRELGDQQGVALSLNDIGRVLVELNRLSDARTAHQEAMDVYQVMADDRGLASSLVSLAMVLNAEGEFEAATDRYTQALLLYEHAEHEFGVADALHHRACTLRRRGLTHAAQRDLERSITIRRDTSDRHGEARSRRELAELLWQENDFEAAAPHARRALELFDELEDPDIGELRSWVADRGDPAIDDSDQA